MALSSRLVQRLVTDKDYAIGMINSISKETNLDPCGEHATKDLRALGLYDMLRVHTRRFLFDNFHVFILTSIILFYFRCCCG